MLSQDRNGRLTASSHPIPLGWGFKSPQAYWREWNLLEPPPSEDALARMSWGTEHEIDAIHAYEALTGEIISFAGENQKFHPYEDWSGCTPDGEWTFGLVEAKCPQTLWEEPSVMYWIQVQSQMAITGYQQADLIAWTPQESRIWRTTVDSTYWPMVTPILLDYWNLLRSSQEPKRGQFKKVKFEPQWERIA